MMIAAAVSAAADPNSISITGGVDNFSYDYEENDTPNTFTIPIMMPVGAAEINGEWTTYAYYNVGFKVEKILRYLLYGGATFNLWLFRLGVGTFVSMFNQGDEEYVPGVSGSLGLEHPGGFSFSIEYGLNAFTNLSQIGNTNLNFGSVRVALWLPHIVVRASVSRNSFTQARGETYTIRNTVLRYEASLDFFGKLFPIVLRVGGGLHTIEKEIAEIPGASYTGIPRSDSREELFALVHFDFELSERAHFLLNLEVTPLPVPGLYYSGTAGFRFNLPEW